MSCERFRRMWVGDDPRERREAERHAAACPDCAEQLTFDRTLAGQVGTWKEDTPDPPEQLGRRIAAIATSSTGRFGRPAARSDSPHRAAFWIWAGAAAALVLAVTIVLQSFSPLATISPLEAAIQEVDTRQHDYARAIARLEVQAAPVLERAADPAVDAERAALLLAYRDRLTHLDDVIAEVQGFLGEHPGHAGGHTVLLAAYEEKDQVLRELLNLQLQPGESS